MITGSILLSTKKALGLDQEYEAFDADIIMDINAALMVLQQLGVGPPEGMVVTSKDEKWSDFLADQTDKNLSAVQQYVYMSVRLAFDPPNNSSVMDSIRKRMDELEWRLDMQQEHG